MFALRDLARRSYEPELMDAGIGSFEFYDQSLRQIETVNHLTFGYRPILRWLRLRLKEGVSVLDVGFGRGALLRAIRGLAVENDRALQLKGIDIAKWSVNAARAATPPAMKIDYRAGDVFHSNETSDFIICSHMTHHLNEDEIGALIGWLETHARRGWFICDLQRHPVSYLLAKLLLFLAPVNYMVRSDGAQSIARALTLKEWRRIVAAAQVDAEVRWHFPFRIGISRIKNP